MSGLAHIFWWLAFTVAGLVLQMFLPRIDALVAGVIVLLQERLYKSMLWILPLFILLQEGLGTRTFGGSILWYVVICVLFLVGERFFNSKTFLFVFFLSAAVGAAYYGLNMLLAPLQNLEIQSQDLLDSSIVQTAVVICTWVITKRLRPGIEEEEE